MKPLHSFTSSRRDGNARHLATLRRILKQQKAPFALATAKQVHGLKIVIVPKLSRTREYRGVDGFITDVPGQPLGIFTADCASIFLSAPSQGLVGLLHAGWRGVAGGILSKALKLMARRWKCRPQAVRVWVGPCIGPCCFEVQWDVARYFPATRKKGGDRWVVDLPGEIRRQARRLGAKVLPGAGHCTRHTSTYHSYRRDQTEARQISVIVRT